MSSPLVTVICLCYNHERFIEECIESVFQQTYNNLQVIVVDDASTDNSVAVIKKLLKRYPDIEFLEITENLGNCKAFNKALDLVRGQFVVDLATDDVFLPERIEKQLQLFDQLDDSYGVVHTDAVFIDEAGERLGTHKKYLLNRGLFKNLPEGDIYKDVLYKYFIAPPSLLVKKEVFDELKGYDEDLAYEDFDFWVRSSRNWKYKYLDLPLTLVRKVKTSMSSGWYQPGDKQLLSTYRVCEKAVKLNQTKEDDEALANRLKYELRQSVFSQNNKEARLFYALLCRLNRNSKLDGLLLGLSKLNLPLAVLRNLYNKIR